jgi:hypothetical protein
MICLSDNLDLGMPLDRDRRLSLIAAIFLTATGIALDRNVTERVFTAFSRLQAFACHPDWFIADCANVRHISS